MLTLRFTSCFGGSFSFFFIFLSISYCIVVVVAPVKPPFMRDSCYRSLQFFLVFLFLCVFGILGTVERVNPFGPMINDRFLFYFLLFCTDFN